MQGLRSVRGPMRCPDDNAIAAYLDGSGAAQRGAIEAHIDGCASCRLLLSDLARMSAATSASMGSWMTVPGREGEGEAVEVTGPGQIIAEKYRIDRVIGSGGMGFVVQATHIVLGQPVALKMLFPESCDHPDAVARFLREARAAARLTSPHVCRVLDVDLLPSGQPFLVMEYLEGEDLAALIRRRGRVPLDEVMSYALAACDALAEAHAIGIVHRDIKPANLFLARQRSGPPAIRVLDFGVAKLTEPDPTGPDGIHTDVRAIMGTPAYMAPEQLLCASSVDARADVWAMGAVLYHLLSGRRPFEASSASEVLRGAMRQDTPALRSVLPDLPAAVDEVVRRCLDKERDCRFANAGELAAALMRAVPGDVVVRVVPEERRGRGAVLAATLGVSLAVAAAAVWVWQIAGEGSRASSAADASPAATPPAAARAEVPAAEPEPIAPSALTPPSEEPAITPVAADAGPAPPRPEPRRASARVRPRRPAVRATVPVPAPTEERKETEEELLDSRQ